MSRTAIRAQCRQILGSAYHRLAPVFPLDKSYKLDEWKKVPEMIEFAERVVIAPAARFLRKAWVDQGP